MAQSIPFAPPPRDPREKLLQQLENAPEDHVEALLDAYKILQLLRDKGLLEITKGALGSGEKLLQEVTKTITTEEAISLIRNLVILTRLLGGLNPEILENVEQALSCNIEKARKTSPPGLMSLCRRLFSPGTRRFLGVITAVSETLGEHLGGAEEPGLRGAKRQMTHRRQVTMIQNRPRD